MYTISKRSLGIRPLSMGVPLPGYATPMRHNDLSSMKRHLQPLKTKKKKIMSSAHYVYAYFIQVHFRLVFANGWLDLLFIEN